MLACLLARSWSLTHSLTHCSIFYSRVILLQSANIFYHRLNCSNQPFKRSIVWQIPSSFYRFHKYDIRKIENNVEINSMNTYTFSGKITMLRTWHKGENIWDGSEGQLILSTHSWKGAGGGWGGGGGGNFKRMAITMTITILSLTWTAIFIPAEYITPLCKIVAFQFHVRNIEHGVLKASFW